MEKLIFYFSNAEASVLKNFHLVNKTLPVTKHGDEVVCSITSDMSLILPTQFGHVCCACMWALKVLYEYTHLIIFDKGKSSEC